jgi:type II secretory ATPase GspE/PulE/Tfp pilus assembly ATPase PilB-like protein
VVSKSGLERAYEYYERAPKPAVHTVGSVEISDTLFQVFKSKFAKFENISKEVEIFDPKTAKTEDVLALILGAAIVARASDIHFEPEERDVRLRYRIDGVLHDATNKFPSELYHFIVSRVKLLSKLKLNVTNEPQNGRFTIFIGKKEIEIRTSIVPSEFAETVVLRVLYAEALAMSLSDLGFRNDDLKLIEEELKQPNGLILNTGPTGSGKTTTLYVFLKAKARPEVKIITIEDPIEYRLEGVEQTQVEKGYDFATALKSALRQDPDIILVGEINNKETAEVAMQAALTGHLVFSTVHANNAPAAIPRLVDLGIKPVGIGPAVNIIIAQRLVRRLCESCRVPQKLSKDMEVGIKKFLNKLPKKVAKPALKDIKIYEPVGCEKCGGFGYKGRVGIFELFLVDEKVEKAIREGMGEGEFLKLARDQGMVSVQEDGILKALNGVTSLTEIEAVTGPIRWQI